MDLEQVAATAYPQLCWLMFVPFASVPLPLGLPVSIPCSTLFSRSLIPPSCCRTAPMCIFHSVAFIQRSIQPFSSSNPKRAKDDIAHYCHPARTKRGPHGIHNGKNLNSSAASAPGSVVSVGIRSACLIINISMPKALRVAQHVSGLT
jgi:hypothetical protein